MWGFSFQQSLGTKVCIISTLIHIMLHPKHKLNVEDYSVHIVKCKIFFFLWAFCQKSWPVRALITTYFPEAMGSSSIQIRHWLLSTLDMMSSPQFLFWNSHVTSAFQRDTILIWASLLIRLAYSHGEVDPAMINWWSACGCAITDLKWAKNWNFNPQASVLKLWLSAAWRTVASLY